MARRSSELAYAAGVFVADGTFCWSGPDQKYPMAAVAMTDEDVVRRFAAALGVGRVLGPYHYPPKLPIWRWQATSWADVYTTYEQLEPWLSERYLARGAMVLTEAK